MQSRNFLDQVRVWLTNRQERLTIKLLLSKQADLKIIDANKRGARLPHQDQIEERAAALDKQACALQELHFLLTAIHLTDEEKLHRLPGLLGAISTLALVDPEYSDRSKRILIETHQSAIRQSLDLRRRSRTVNNPE